MSDKVDFCIIISAGTEWRAVLPHFPDAKTQPTPFGDYFTAVINGQDLSFLHSGWGKVASAGATQYAIDRWGPRLLVNLGTCGGVEGLVRLNDVILAEETVIYDIIEGMSSYQSAIERYSVRANLDWLGSSLPFQVKRLRLYSADRDIRPEDVSGILRDFGAAAADWESGAFAWISDRNQKDWLVLRSVTDLVSDHYGEALGNADLWRERTREVMGTLVSYLPWILDRYNKTH
ncbi:MAG: 5'-methylthioadenosine/S-adenosylhomocysteine nucleosidase [Chloroflexota bacterium]|nr:5'-methylthioadenosine/S-adenosylhomocysteine nucleosidase [Chloroflexota bacterium]